MVSAAPLCQRRPAGVAPGSGSRSGAPGTFFPRSAGAAADPVALLEDDERSALTLIRLVVLAAIAVAILGVAAQMFG
jgi:preprotein translocase subunit Sec61beta